MVTVAVPRPVPLIVVVVMNGVIIHQLLVLKLALPEFASHVPLSVGFVLPVPTVRSPVGQNVPVTATVLAAIVVTLAPPAPAIKLILPLPV